MAKVSRLPMARYEAGQPSPYRPNPPQSYSADYEYAVSYRYLRDWVRHLADNSSIINAILSSRVSNAIGAGLIYEPLVRDRKGNLLVELNDAIRRIHQRWSKDADVTGELSRSEVERMAWRTWDLDGEIFIRRVNQRFTTTRQDLPYRVQLMRPDLVPSNLTGNFDNRRLVHGIEKDQWGRPVRYYIEPNAQDIYSQPGIYLNPQNMIKLPADQVWHLKRIQSPGQTRGITLFHSIIFRIADIGNFQESHRLAAAASADLFASINRSSDWGLTNQPPIDDTETDAQNKTKRQWDFEHLQMIDNLQAGESVNFHSPEHPNQNAVDFVREELRAIASATDVGFSQIAQVFDSSYAAQRLEVVDTWRKTERDRSKFINDFARPALYEWVVESARLSGQLPARQLRKADPDTLLDVRIDGPTMPVIDPVKDRQAFELDQLNKWDSRHGIIRRQGRQPRDVDAEIDKDNKLMQQRESLLTEQDDQQDDEQIGE